jgi:prepilin-type N-terminal cleavage/methylation domain-containing protein
MMFHRPKSINKNQKGFTLLEMLLALLIGAIITGGITATIFQVVFGSARTNNHMTAVRQVESAGYWVSHDVQMAQTVVLARDADGFPLSLSWIDSLGPPKVVTYTTYTIEGSDLKRQQVVGSQPSTTTTVARFIVLDPAKTKCQITGGGAFTLPDSNDAFTISGGAVPDSGQITVTSGTISVTTAGSATINGAGTWTGTAGQSAPWTTPAAGGTVVVRATVAGTGGGWTSTAASATAAITADYDGDATITGSVLLSFTVTATVGPSSQRQSETRTYKIVSRPSP